jgi:NADH-quinone oxidoreductase subunit L
LYYFIGVGGALLTAFYMFRLYALTFMGKFRGTHEQEHHLHESPWQMTFPLIVLAVLSVVGGFIGIPEAIAPDAHSLEHFLAPIFAASAQLGAKHHIERSQELMMMAGSTIAIVIVVILAVRMYRNYKPQEAEETGVLKVLQNKWYVDELYDAVIVNPLNSLAGFLKNIVEKSGIDGVVNGAGRLVGYGSRQLRLLQSGQVGSYILVMVLAMVVFVLIWFNDQAIMRFISKIF